MGVLDILAEFGEQNDGSDYDHDGDNRNDVEMMIHSACHTMTEELHGKTDSKEAERPAQDVGDDESEEFDLEKSGNEIENLVWKRRER